MSPKTSKEIALTRKCVWTFCGIGAQSVNVPVLADDDGFVGSDNGDWRIHDLKYWFCLKL